MSNIDDLIIVKKRQPPEPNEGEPAPDPYFDEYVAELCITYTRRVSNHTGLSTDVAFEREAHNHLRAAVKHAVFGELLDELVEFRHYMDSSHYMDSNIRPLTGEYHEVRHRLTQIMEKLK